MFAFAFVVLGLPDAAHGAAWPSMRSEFHRPLADLGFFLIAQGVGYLTVALGAGRLAARWTVDGLVIGSTVTCCAPCDHADSSCNSTGPCTSFVQRPIFPSRNHTA